MSAKADPNSLKKCAMCGEYKVRSEGFYWRKHNHWDSRCKECRHKVSREYNYRVRGQKPPGKWKAKREAAPEGTKYCKRCDSYKPLDEFYCKGDGTRRGSTCKACLQKEHQETYVSRRKKPVMTPEEKAIAIKQSHYRKALRDRGYGGPNHTWEEWQGVMDKYGRKCLKCGKPEEHTVMTRDHIVPLADGGLDTIDNI